MCSITWIVEVLMTEEVYKMTAQELNRVDILRKVDEKRISQKEAAKLLGCTTRNIRYLQARYHQEGVAGVISKQRGKPSNRAFPASFKINIMGIIGDKYSDFGPTFASECLQERDGISVSRETTRQWMIEGNFWHPKASAKPVAHPPRERRSNYGALVQIDGSPHDWFEGRGPVCCLIVFVDDATSRIQLMRFFPAETTFAYFNTTKTYIERYGLPQGLYSDRHNIFRVNQKDPICSTGLTQFGRAMESLGIDLLHASSAQAKGKVERKNRLLQDRLIKEMRLDGINNMEMANGEYLDKLTEKYNKKFAVPPYHPEDAHCPVQDLSILDLHFTHQEPRKVSKNNTISYKNKIFVLEKPDKVRSLHLAQVIVCESESGKITILYKGQSLSHQVYNKKQYYREPCSRHEVTTMPLSPQKKRRHVPPPDHPWRKKWRNAS